MSDEEFVIKLIGGSMGMKDYPELLEQVGRFVVRYEPQRAPEGAQWIWTTDDPDEAQGFPDIASAHEAYSTSVGTRPWDGKPDRPISAYHVEIALRSSFKVPA